MENVEWHTASLSLTSVKILPLLKEGSRVAVGEMLLLLRE